MIEEEDVQEDVQQEVSIDGSATKLNLLEVPLSVTGKTWAKDALGCTML
jgi:hypothetical protein